MKLIITLALLAIAAAPAWAGFEHTNPADARINCAKLGQIIVEMEPVPNISVSYTEGYCPDSSTFRPMGSGHIVLQDIPAGSATAVDGRQQAAHPEYLDFTQAITAVRDMIGPGFTAAAEAWLQAKIAEMRLRPEIYR